MPVNKPFKTLYPSGNGRDYSWVDRVSEGLEMASALIYDTLYVIDVQIYVDCDVTRELGLRIAKTMTNLITLLGVV